MLIESLSLSSIMGVPATISADHTILSALANGSTELPRVLYNLLQISFRAHKFSSLLGHNERTADGLIPEPFSLIRAHDLEVEVVEHRDLVPWNVALMVANLAAKLHIYTYALRHFRSHKTDDVISKVESLQAAEYVSRAQRTAMDIIDLCCSEEARSNFYQNTASSQVPKSADQPVHWTLFETHGLLLAVFVLPKITSFGT